MTGNATIQTPAASSRLTTLAVAKAELGLTDTSQDTLVTSLIDRASAAIVSHCGFVFGAETIAETFRASATPGRCASLRALDQRRRPLVLGKALPGSPPALQGVSEVVENGTTLTAGTDYEVDAGAGIVQRLNGTLPGLWTFPVVVTYVSGWALPGDADRTLPFDVEDACLALVRAAYAGKDRDPGVALDMLNGDRAQYFDRGAARMAIDAALAAQLEPYRVGFV